MAAVATEATESLPKEAGLVGLQHLDACLKGMRSITLIILVSVNQVGLV